MKEQKNVTFGHSRRVHVEAPGCIVNITRGLNTSAGQEVTAVTIVCDNYAGEAAVTIPDLLTIEEAAEIITKNYERFDLEDAEQLIRRKLAAKGPRRSINVRVVRDRA